MYWDRKCKNITRDLVQPSNKKKNTLWFPGVDALDVKTAFKNNLIDNTGHHILIEKDELNAKKLLANIKSIPIDFTLHLDSLSTLGLEKDLDYAHFDFCGGLTAETATWLFDDLRLSHGAEVHFTFAYALRGSKFLHGCDNLFSGHSSFRELERINYCDANRGNMRIAFYCSMIRCMLNKYEYESLQPIWYKDSVQSMVLYRCQNVRKINPLVHLDFRYYHMDTTWKKGGPPVNAAKKAWKTRKANALKEKRSNAAKKAWETRRASV